MTGGSARTLPSPFLNWESEGLNRNQSQQFIFNFFLLSRDWFLSLWSMAQRKAPWPEQLFKHLVWSAPHLSNRTLEADYGSNRMKMFEGWAWLPLPSWEECLQAGGCLCSSPGERQGWETAGCCYPQWAEASRRKPGRAGKHWGFTPPLPAWLPPAFRF